MQTFKKKLLQSFLKRIDLGIDIVKGILIGPFGKIGSFVKGNGIRINSDNQVNSNKQNKFHKRCHVDEGYQ